MKILIIGGTKFVGRTLTQTLLERDHEVTLFHRGQTNPDIFPEVERIYGDREVDIEKLGAQSWDAVIDTCGYYPRIVNISLNHLSDKSDMYVFISSLSVYKRTDEIGIDETAELKKLDDPTIEDMNADDNVYGGLKVLCEDAVRNHFKDKSLIVRPGLIVGPHDPTNRFTYWPVRIRKGKEVIVPDDKEFPVQFIDVRDLALFIINLIESKTTGTFHVTGPDDQLLFEEFLLKCKEVTDSNAKFIWVDPDWLLNHGIEPWSEIPLWIPGPYGKAIGQVDISKAKGHGLTFRPLEETILDTLEWYDSINGDDQEWDNGLKPHKEHDLLDEITIS